MFSKVRCIARRMHPLDTTRERTTLISKNLSKRVREVLTTGLCVEVLTEVGLVNFTYRTFLYRTSRTTK